MRFEKVIKTILNIKKKLWQNDIKITKAHAERERERERER